MATTASSASSFDASVGASPSTSATPSTASTEPEKQVDDSGKLRLFLGILRKFIGITDLAAVRFSLPAQLLEPTPNLEYWNYLDRPEMFVAIGDSDEALERMLEVLRFWFTKDLKYVKGKPCKPYNSALGEFFRCNWEVTEAAPPVSSLQLKASAGSSSASSVKSSKSSSRPGTANPQTTKLDKPILVSYLTEQTSHHPPVSAFYVDCPEKGISARGFDQIAAKFTGTSIKVSPGEHNLGIFVTLHRRDGEAYQLTHPTAHLAGLLRGALSVTVGDKCFVTCPKTKIKTILHYVEEGWLGRTQNRVDGVIFNYDPENDTVVQVKDVPEKDILARISGNWREKLFVSMGAKFSDTPTVLLDLGPLSLSPKVLPPEDLQLPNESLRFWGGVTTAIKAKQFGKATTVKQEIEESQRQKAKERETAVKEGGEGVHYRPRFFKGATEANGRPELTDEGKDVLERIQKGDWVLKEGEGVMA